MCTRPLNQSPPITGASASRRQHHVHAGALLIKQRGDAARAGAVARLGELERQLDIAATLLAEYRDELGALPAAVREQVRLGAPPELAIIDWRL